MKSIQCWEGSNSTLHRSEIDAAADILANAKQFEIKCITDTPPRNQQVLEAILWLADHYRSAKKSKR